MPRLRKKVEPEVVPEPVAEVIKGQRKPRKKKVEDEQPEPIVEVQAVEPEPIKKTRKRAPKPVPEPEPIPEVIPIKKEKKVVIKKEKPIGRQRPVEPEPKVEPVKEIPKPVVKKAKKVVVKKPAPVIKRPEPVKKLTKKQIEKQIEQEKVDTSVPQQAPKKTENFMVEATPSIKRSEDKYISIKENANADERKLMSDKVQKNEVIFSHYAIDNDHGVHYYRVLTKNK